MIQIEDTFDIKRVGMVYCLEFPEEIPVFEVGEPLIAMTPDGRLLEAVMTKKERFSDGTLMTTLKPHRRYGIQLQVEGDVALPEKSFIKRKGLENA